MIESVAWNVHLIVREGRFDEFVALTAEMVEAAREEPGCLSFERFVNSDRSRVHVYERYVNSRAAILHLSRFEEQFSDRFQQLIEREQFSVYGHPSADLQSMLDPLGATYLSMLDGFHQQSNQ